MNSENPEIEKQAKIFAFKQESSRAIESLLRSGAPLDEVARLIGAEEYLKYEKKSSQAPSLRFDVEGFINDQIQHGTYLKLPDQFVKMDRVILPPDPGEILQGRGGGLEKKKIIPRTRYLVEVFTGLAQNYQVVRGENDPNMMRKFSYLMFYAPESDTLILVNDEEGNATFVVRNVSDQQEDWEKIYGLTKDELKNSDYDIEAINYPGNEVEWKQKIAQAILNPGEKSFKKKRTPWKGTRIENAATEKVPEGWLTNKGLSNEFSCAQEIISQIIDPYKETHPEWFKDYLDQGNRTFQFCHPDLVAIVREVMKQRGEPAPEGWMTNSMVADGLGVVRKTFEKITDEYRVTHPEWFKDYLPRRGPIREHLHPELIKIIRTEIGKRENAPEGWYTASEIKKEVGYRNIVDNISDKYRGVHPEWFKSYFNKAQRESEYFHPDLVEQIRKETRMLGELAPEEWRTATALAIELDSSSSTIARMADRYKKTNPEWFLMALSQKNRIMAEHFHPDLVVALRDDYAKREQAPPGWSNCSRLAEHLDVSFNLVDKTAESFEAAHPEWFAEYLDRVKKKVIFYSPELVEEITKRIRERGEPAPDGWMTKEGLCNELGADYWQVLLFAEKFRETNPDWFKFALGANHQSHEHFHPDLIREIRDKFSPPESWINLRTLSSELGISKKEILGIVNFYREASFDEIGTFGNRGRVEEYYAPDLADIIRDDIKKEALKKKTSTIGIENEIETEGRFDIDEYSRPPEGWMTVRQVAEMFSAQKPTVLKMVARYRISNPEYFSVYYLAKRKVKKEHLHPELIDLIGKDLNNKAPEGWFSMGKLAAKHKVAYNVIERRVEQYGKDKPELFGVYNFGSRKLTYLHPDLVKTIEDELNQRELPPEGWFNYPLLADKLSVDWATVVKWTKPYKNSHPQWFKKYLDRSGEMTEHLHPDLVELFTKKVDAEFTRKPEGWLSVNELKNKIDFSGHIVNNFAEKYRGEHPDWFKTHRNASNVPTEYFSPELVEIIEREIKEYRRPAPEGWLTIIGLASALSMNLSSLRHYIERSKFEERHQDKCIEYLNKKNRPAIHYHPDLVEILKAELKAK